MLLEHLYLTTSQAIHVLCPGLRLLESFWACIHSQSISDLSIMVSVKPSYLAYAVVSSVLTALSAACVTLRFLQRQRVAGLQWDDWTILLALVMSVACLVVILLPTSIDPRILENNPNNIFTETELNIWLKVSLVARNHVSTMLILKCGLQGFYCYTNALCRQRHPLQILNCDLLSSNLLSGHNISHVHSVHATFYFSVLSHVRICFSFCLYPYRGSVGCLHASYELAHTDEGIRYPNKCDRRTFGRLSIFYGRRQDVEAADRQETQDLVIPVVFC